MSVLSSQVGLEFERHFPFYGVFSGSFMLLTMINERTAIRELLSEDIWMCLLKLKQETERLGNGMHAIDKRISSIPQKYIQKPPDVVDLF